MRTLVLGGAGFLGRHVVATLLARGHQVVIGTRRPGHAAAIAHAAQHCERRIVRFGVPLPARIWRSTLDRIDAVVNCVGILRPRLGESYEAVHHHAPAALAAACAERGVRIVHVSALGLAAEARSNFIRSKLRGENAIRMSGAAWTIVRPSLLEGDGGFGARWMRFLARLPVHLVPADALGRIAALDARDAGEAIAVLSAVPAAAGSCIAEIGGMEQRTMAEYLAALRKGQGLPAARCIRLPATVARIASHLCDLVHISPFSFGHLELMRRDNVPTINRLPELLGRAPRTVGIGALDSDCAHAMPAYVVRG